MSRSNSIEIHKNLQAALDLGRAGIRVFPVTPDKHPLVKWKTEATTSEAKIRRWWRKWPDAMPAFATGDESGIDVLDLDRKDGKDGFKALARLGRFFRRTCHAGRGIRDSSGPNMKMKIEIPVFPDLPSLLRGTSLGCPEQNRTGRD